MSTPVDSEKYTKSDGECTQQDVKGCPLVLAYYSAHWCPPCRQFTPILAAWYKEVNKDGKKVEIVFCSLDHDEKQFKEYLGTQPWCALPWTYDRKAVATKAGVQGIPALHVLGKDGSTKDANGRGLVSASPPADSYAKMLALV